MPFFFAHWTADCGVPHSVFSPHLFLDHTITITPLTTHTYIYTSLPHDKHHNEMNIFFSSVFCLFLFKRMFGFPL